jgi:hypothetical protein
MVTDFEGMDIYHGRNKFYPCLNERGQFAIGTYDNNDDWHELTPMQFIGIKDCQGKDIYEGDLCKTVSMDIVEVVWNNTDSAFELKLKNKGLMGIAGINSTIEVIGNIYENPELLKEAE